MLPTNYKYSNRCYPATMSYSKSLNKSLKVNVKIFKVINTDITNFSGVNIVGFDQNLSTFMMVLLCFVVEYVIIWSYHMVIIIIINHNVIIVMINYIHVSLLNPI